MCFNFGNQFSNYCLLSHRPFDFFPWDTSCSFPGALLHTGWHTPFRAFLSHVPLVHLAILYHFLLHCCGIVTPTSHLRKQCEFLLMAGVQPITSKKVWQQECVRCLVTLYPPSGNKGWLLVLCSVSLVFIAVSHILDPSPCGGDAHIQSSVLSSLFWKHSDTQAEVCFHRNSKSSHVDNEDEQSHTISSDGCHSAYT